MALISEVKLFLQEWRRAANNFIYFVPRDKNQEGMKRLGFTMNIARDMLRHISLENYVKGPERDHGKPNEEVWIFGIREVGYEIYIKIKILKIGAALQGKCLSFHPAEYPLRYPFAGV